MTVSWYILNTLSGYEQRIARHIKDEAEKKGLRDLIHEVVVPVESVSELRRGKKVQTSKKIFPGYILIKMQLDDETWSMVKNIPNVAKFLGSKNKPAKIQEHEVSRILKQMAEGVVVKEDDASYEVGELVKIIDGPFEAFTGAIEGVDNVKRRLKVLVSILGRDTPVELEFDQVKKCNE